MRRSPLNRMSAKRKAELPSRAKCCREVRERCGGKCEANLADICAGAMRDTHEIKARSQGGSITDPANCLGVCGACHTWITEHMNAARRLGLAE